MLFCEMCEVLQNFVFTEDSWATASDFQQYFGLITCSVNNKSTWSQLPGCLGSPQRALSKQFTVLVSKIFEISKVEGNTFFVAEVNKQKRVFSRSSHPEVFCKKNVLKYLVKLTGKRLCRSLSLACRLKRY